MRWLAVLSLLPSLAAADLAHSHAKANTIGQELAVPHHLRDDDEFRLPLSELIEYGKKLFMANWTEQDGGGRPLTKGTGKALSDSRAPLAGIRSFNRIS